MKKILYILSLLLTSGICAQNVEFEKDNFRDNKDGLKEAKRNIEAGDKFMEMGDAYFKLAIEPYLNANVFNPNNALLNYKLGQAYLHSNYKLKSIPYLEKAVKLNPQINPEIHYLLGKAYHLDMQWDKAIKEFQTVQQSLKGAELELLNADINNHVAQCLNGKEMVQHPI